MSINGIILNQPFTLENLHQSKKSLLSNLETFPYCFCQPIMLCRSLSFTIFEALCKLTYLSKLIRDMVFDVLIVGRGGRTCVMYGSHLLAGPVRKKGYILFIESSSHLPYLRNFIEILSKNDVFIIQ